MQDQHNNISGVVGMTHAARTASANGATIDLAPQTGANAGNVFQSVTFIVMTATTTTADGSNKFSFKLQHGNLSDGSDMADVALADQQVTGEIDVATEDDTIVSKISYLPTSVRGRRYVRLVATATGSPSAAFGAVCVLGNPRTAPVN
jgi:hypothetical protein